MNNQKAFPHCPKCGTTLQQVEYSGGMLNEDQWRSTRAGDWFCVTCKSDKARTGYLYFWNREMMSRPDINGQTARGRLSAYLWEKQIDIDFGFGKANELLAAIEESACEAGRREGETKLENAVSERDAAEEFASQIYFIVTGHSPEWSNTFGFQQAAQEIEEAINLLKQAAKSNVVVNKTKLFPQV